MANAIDYVIDVLAADSAEINRIAARLLRPSTGLTQWVAERWARERDELAQSLAELVKFEPVANLFALSDSLNRARRFRNRFRKWTGIVKSHLLEVSAEFPNAVFLLEHRDEQFSYSGKSVIRAGQIVCETFDGNQHAQAIDWALPDIFAPFTAEWDLGLEFGSLWSEWVKDLAEAVGRLSNIRKSEGGRD